MILIIGYGNSLCGDDGVGPYLIEQLAYLGTKLPEPVNLLSVRQLTPELSEQVSRAETVIFVDAAFGETPGKVSCYKLTNTTSVLRALHPGVHTHHVDAFLLLSYARQLYGRRPLAYLYTIVGQNFGLGDPFSPAVEVALPALLSRLKARITRCMNLASPK